MPSLPGPTLGGHPLKSRSPKKCSTAYGLLTRMVYFFELLPSTLDAQQEIRGGSCIQRCCLREIDLCLSRVLSVVRSDC